MGSLNGMCVGPVPRAVVQGFLVPKGSSAVHGACFAFNFDAMAIIVDVTLFSGQRV